MKEINISVPEKGRDERVENYERVSNFVKDNLGVLYQGALKAEEFGLSIDRKSVQAIPADHYAPDRVQVGGIRLHAIQGLKWTSNWSLKESLAGNAYAAPSDEDLKEAVTVIMGLLELYGQDIKSSIKIEVTNK